MNGSQGFDSFMQSRMGYNPQPVAAAPAKKKKGFLVDNISTAGGIIGGIGGGLVGGAAGFGLGAVPGAGIGGAIGSGLGETIENMITGDSLGTNVGKEALLGGVFSAGPIKLAKLGLGLPAALASRGAGEAAGMGVKSFAQGGAKMLAGDVAQEGGEQALKTSLTGQLTNTGNKALAAQYGTIGKNIARETDPINTIGKLADIGITRPQDAERIAHAITGADGILTKQVAAAIGAAGNVPLTTLPKVLSKSVELNGLSGISKGTALTKQVNAYLKGIKAAGGTPESVMDAVRSMEGQAADLLGKGGNYHLATSTDKQVAKVLRNVTDELKAQLYNAAGANKNIKNVLTPELREQLIQLNPKSNEWHRFVNQTVMTAKDIGQLRNAQSPFVKIGKVIDEADLNSITFGGRLGNYVNGNGSLGGLAAGLGVSIAKNPTARFAGKNLRDIGSGEIANQGSKGIAGLTSSLGAVSMLNGSMSGGTPSMDGQSLDPAMTDQNAVMNPSMNSASNPMAMNPAMNNNMGQSYQNTPQQSSPYSKDALMYDINRDPANAQKYIQYYQQLDEIFNPVQDIAAAKPLNEGQQMRADLMKALDLSESAVDAGSINYGQIGSRIDGIKGMFNAADPETLAYKNTVSGLRAAITKARAGTSLTDGEKAMLNQYTPSDTDSEQVVRSKLQALRNLYGYGDVIGGGLDNTLMQQSQYGGAY